jgi:hypothetical protein
VSYAVLIPVVVILVTVPKAAQTVPKKAIAFAKMQIIS